MTDHLSPAAVSLRSEGRTMTNCQRCGGDPKLLAHRCRWEDCPTRWIPDATVPAVPQGAAAEPGDREVETYPEAALSIALNLAEFCDESKPYPAMIADAARQARRALEATRSLLRETTQELIAETVAGAAAEPTREWDDYAIHHYDCDKLRSTVEDTYPCTCDGAARLAALRQSLASAEAKLTASEATREALHDDLDRTHAALASAEAMYVEACGERDALAMHPPTEPDYERAHQAFHRVTAYWAPEWGNDRDMFAKMLDAVLDAALSPSPSEPAR